MASPYSNWGIWGSWSSEAQPSWNQSGLLFGVTTYSLRHREPPPQLSTMKRSVSLSNHNYISSPSPVVLETFCVFSRAPTVTKPCRGWEGISVSLFQDIRHPLWPSTLGPHSLGRACMQQAGSCQVGLRASLFSPHACPTHRLLPLQPP